MSAYREQLTIFEGHMRGVEYQLESATRHHAAHYDEAAVETLIAAMQDMRRALLALDERLRVEEKILTE